MCGILTRIDSLNQQLISISKLQEMEEEYSTNHRSPCKKCSIQNVGKCCHCKCHAFSLKEPCNRSNCSQECFVYDSKPRGYCDARICKTRRKLLHCITAQLNEVQAVVRSDVQPSKSVSTYANTNSHNSVKVNEKHNKSDQVNLNPQLHKSHGHDNTVSQDSEKQNENDEHDKSKELPPTRNFRPEVSVHSMNANDKQLETPKEGTAQVEANAELDVHVIAINDGKHRRPMMDKEAVDQMKKELINEKERNKELEKQLKSLTCSFNCLKEDSEQKAACLKDALENAEGQYKIAVDLAKKSKNQSDLFKADRDELVAEITKLQQQIIEVAHANTALTQERDGLNNKLASLSEDESKRCEEIEKEVNKLKVAVREKEDALSKERKEFMHMISELSNVIKIQKRRLCEVSGICNNQQRMLHEKDEDLSQKNNELSEKELLLQSRDCYCKELEEKVEQLKYCLQEEEEACNCLRQEIEDLKDNHNANQRIKEKIVEEQNRTIAKQRKLLHDSEEVAQQAALEFDQLKDEVYQEKDKNISLQVLLDKTNTHMKEIYSLGCEKCTELGREIAYLKDELYKEKQKNVSMQVVLDKTNNHTEGMYPSECDQCTALRCEVDYLKQEKQRALMIAKFAYQKFHESVKDYQMQLNYEKQQQKYLASIIEKKKDEIECLKCQLCQTSFKNF